MEDVNCLNCTRLISVDDLKCRPREVEDKLKILFKNIDFSTSEDTHVPKILCNDCYLIFNKLFVARLTFSSLTNLDSKLASIKQRRISCDSNVSSASIEIIDIEDSDLELDEEIECIVPGNNEEYIDGTETNTRTPATLNTASNNSSDVAPLTEFNETFLEIKIPKLDEYSFLLFSGLCRDSSDNAYHCCSTCTRYFETEDLMTNHISLVHSPKLFPYSCNLCEKQFVQKWFYKNHLDTCHNSIQISFSCLLCEKQFRTQKELDDHKAKFHRSPFKCKYCLVSFEEIDEVRLLRLHLIEFHGDTPEAKAAAFNEKYYEENEDLGTLGRLKKNFTLPCSVCGKMIEGSFACSVHIIFDHYNQKSCQVCNEEFACSNDLKNHLQTFGHRFKECKLCNKKFESMQSLLRHLTFIHNQSIQYSFVCECCGKAFQSYLYLRKHYSIHFLKSRLPKHICHECNKGFLLQKNLMEHMDSHRHSKKRDFKCTQCNNKSFIRQANLNQHILKVHTATDDSVLHKCPECEFTCDSIVGISLHRRKHVGNPDYGARKKKISLESEFVQIISTSGKDARFQDGYNHNRLSYRCTKCDEVVFSSYAISRHLYLDHSILLPGFKISTIKDFKCTKCDAVFYNKVKWQKHNSKHVKESHMILFKCTICLEKIRGIDNLRDHFITIHRGTEEAERSAKNNLRSYKDSETTGKQPFCSQTDLFCIYCKIIFSTMLEKDDHNKQVHKTQPVCKLCQQVCEDETSYREHESTHTDFQCVPCETPFSSMKEFCNHLEDVHARYPYICECCGTYISTSDMLMKHYERKHASKEYNKEK